MKKILIAGIFLSLSVPSFAARQAVTSGTGATHQWSVQKDRINANFVETYGHKVASGTVLGSNLTLTLADASTITVDVATLVNTDTQTITNLSLNSTTNVLTIALSGGNTATVDLSGLISAGGLADAPSDDAVYGRQNGAWVVVSGSGAVDSVNSQTGAVVLDADDISDTTTTKKFTSAGDIAKMANVPADTNAALDTKANTADMGTLGTGVDTAIETAVNTTGGIVTVGNSSATSAPLPAYTAGAGTVAQGDTLLQAIQKLDGNIAAVEVGGFAFDTYPTYEDSPHAGTGIALNGTTLAVYSSAASKWLTVGLTDSLDPAPVVPTLSSRVIGTDGETLTLTGSASLSVGAGGNGGFDVDCSTAGSNISATYASGAPGSALVYTLGEVVLDDDTCDLDYTQPGDGIEATTGGADLASISSAAVTNNSTQTASACSCTGTTLFCWDAESTTITSGTPAGCSVGDTSATAVSAVEDILTVNQTYVHSGSHSVHPTSTSDYYELSVSTEDIVKSDAGRIEAWVYNPSGAAINAYAFVRGDGTNSITIQYNNNTARAIYRGNNIAQELVGPTNSIVDDDWTFIVVSWSTTAVSGHYLRIGTSTDGSTPTNWTYHDTAITDMTVNPTSIRIGEVTGNAFDHYIDSVKILSEW